MAFCGHWPTTAISAPEPSSQTCGMAEERSGGLSHGAVITALAMIAKIGFAALAKLKRAQLSYRCNGRRNVQTATTQKD